MRQGPLTSLKVIEFAGLGPAPFCGMLLGDLGAEVIRIDRPGTETPHTQVSSRSRRAVEFDLKRPEAREACLRLVAGADALIEGFRPGVMERLGLGPEACLAVNPRLVYGRMTGWGQDGPLAQAAGHDINYIALSGALDAIGTPDRPLHPLNLVGDFGGGALYLAFGLLAAVLHARESGTGQVIDCAITDGAASLMALIYGWHAAGGWKIQRRGNRIDGGSHYYDTYRCADGKWITLGPLEPKFYALMREKLGLTDAEFDHQNDPARWPALKARVAEAVAGRTRDEWCAALEGTDVCFAPVLNIAEAPHHPHNAARGTFVTEAGVVQPAPAPRFSATPGAIQRLPHEIGADPRGTLAEWGLGADEIDALAASGAASGL